MAVCGGLLTVCCLQHFGQLTSTHSLVDRRSFWGHVFQLKQNYIVASESCHVKTDFVIQLVLLFFVTVVVHAVVVCGGPRCGGLWWSTLWWSVVVHAVVVCGGLRCGGL